MPQTTHLLVASMTIYASNWMQQIYCPINEEENGH